LDIAFADRWLDAVASNEKKASASPAKDKASALKNRHWEEGPRVRRPQNWFITESTFLAEKNDSDNLDLVEVLITGWVRHH